MIIGKTEIYNANTGNVFLGINDNGALKEMPFSNTGIKYYEHRSAHVKGDDFIIQNFMQMKNIVTIIPPSLPQL